MTTKQETYFGSFPCLDLPKASEAIDIEGLRVIID
jgi:hypothetical protein